MGALKSVRSHICKFAYYFMGGISLITWEAQICPNCGAMRKKTLDERWHLCVCGDELDRDSALISKGHLRPGTKAAFDRDAANIGVEASFSKQGISLEIEPGTGVPLLLMAIQLRFCSALCPSFVRSSISSRRPPA
jgi:hypothetical protein